MNNDELLPVGTIVVLAGGEVPVVIIGIAKNVEQDGQELFFDYAGTVYPQGMDQENIFYFNRGDIASVIFKGFVDATFQEFAGEVETYLQDNAESIVYGQTAVDQTEE